MFQRNAQSLNSAPQAATKATPKATPKVTEQDKAQAAQQAVTWLMVKIVSFWCRGWPSFWWGNPQFWWVKTQFCGWRSTNSLVGQKSNRWVFHIGGWTLYFGEWKPPWSPFFWCVPVFKDVQKPWGVASLTGIHGGWWCCRGGWGARAQWIS